MNIEQIKQKILKEKKERYNNILEYWKTRKSFKDENDIGSIAIISEQD